MKEFLLTFPRNFLSCFRGKYLPLHLLAFALTWLLVVSGIDWAYFKSVQEPGLRIALYSAGMIGFLLPILLPLTLLGIGTAKNDKSLKSIAWAIAQAALIGLLLSFFYKALTGRPQPNLVDLTKDVSNTFRFGILRGGVFWGWPSSHTTVAFSMAVTVFLLQRKNALISYGALAYALYIGISVSFGIHWFSEFVAGAIFGSIVGIVVGTAFLKHSHKGA